MNLSATEIVVSAEAATAIRVRGFRREDAARWDEFVDHCPDATFFHRIGWKAVLEGCFGHKMH